MVKTKLILVAIATSLAVGSTGLWLLISEKQAAWERREKFFGSSKEYPTSGGEKMKIEW
ncbi:entry exclusion protein TrbK [Rhizobium leguminosarum]|uniref:entry exclusion protein TrbK n=1 Tax=Rhizobium leguminosarum TaxID=384 RepID=UPI00103C6090|nr:entry exclusion protein TrbK [Rhizobium leguminosarum]MBY5345475.1 entry exclusion protein TrbK [Rhizobium leguminosarum]MBY5391828.1 entry exclusion protein TrbK [Rhizobium leguminosarum]MBY5434242.1 entry exclusion protein TrbK [Rhizobium leguminosarum]NEK39633.1 entry exclusion protein TrbK [Rhizobium leguminosarum]NEK46741.1 entry exclusion protein TrbK [Rhizobium leguminosarum]